MTTEFTWSLDDLRESQGRYRTRSLFFEFKHEVDGYDPIFTLKPVDHAGCISLKRLYLMYAMPEHEYEFAIRVFGLWEHWQKLCKPAWFKPYLNAWREELEIKVRTEAILAMNETAKLEGGKGTAAAKWLAEGKWKGLRGRPTKEEIAGKLKQNAEIEENLAEHAGLFEEYTRVNKSH